MNKKIASYPTNPSRRILAAEDEPDIRQLNVEVLKDCGYKVDVAEDGLCAWQLLNSNRYDLLITDNEMPGATGIDLLEKLHEARDPLPVIMVTGTLPSEKLHQRPWLKLHAMLLKPYNTVDFLAMVNEVLPMTINSSRRKRPSLNWQTRLIVSA